MKIFAQRIISGSAWAFGGKICIAGGSFIANAMLIRLMNPTEVGTYFIAISLVSIASTVAIFGMNQTVVRLIAERMAHGQTTGAVKVIKIALATTIIGVVLIIALVAGGVGEILADTVFQAPLLKEILVFVMVWIAILSFQNLIAEIFRGFHDIRFATVFGGLVSSVLTALFFSGLILMQKESGLTTIVSLSILACGVSLVGAVFVLFHIMSKMEKTEDEGLPLQAVLSISFPLWITNITLLVLSQVAIWVIGIFQTQSEVAIFGAVLRLVTLVSMTLLILNAVVPPIIAELTAKGRKGELEHSLRTATSIAAIPAILFLLLFIGWGEEVLGLVYGEYYKEGAQILLLLSLGKLVAVCTGSCGQALMMTGHQKTMMLLTLVSGCFIVIFSVVFVQSYGAVGVAAVAMMGIIIQNAAMLIMAKKKIGIWTHIILRPKLSTLNIKT